ncbi:tumor necrosis factor receptor superfamily member 16-like isoform X2 [Stylophora pistillata]|uniref:tumor necrosis factor receptor superfamily member 16-like isoform X2 n=1 Tax=Stylophora pistillata TaxID=50429 RepID=UPI000C04B82C|nr:tumor necrosis factor receptor superfamily member 16-like isoform X2 [Stylophora pistillata]
MLRNLLYFVTIVKITFAALDCPPLNYFNGTHCTQCTKCPPGFGVRTNCTPEKDTVCQPCYPRYDYSNTTGYEPCILCHTHSNCMEGAFKVIKTCTIFGPYVCDGCAEGYYFNPSSGLNGACTKCRQPCNNLEEEKRTCKTEHNRMCVLAIKTPPTVRVSSNSSRERTVVPELDSVETTVIPTETSIQPDAAGTTPIAKETSTSEPWQGNPSAEITVVPESDAVETTVAPTETSVQQSKENLWFKIGLAAVALLVCALMGIKCKRGCEKKKKKERGKTKRGGNIEMQDVPLMRGLDCPIQDLPVSNRKSISKMPNGKDFLGYFYWRIVAENLGLGNDWEAWGISENPTELLLKSYGQKSGSTIQGLIRALKEADLTKFADDIENMFATPPQGGP